MRDAHCRNASERSGKICSFCRGAPAPGFGFSPDSVVITEHGREIPFTVRDGVISVEDQPGQPGERVYAVCVNGVHIWCRILYLPALGKLAEARCRFIARRQQLHKEGSRLSVAYLTYDNDYCKPPVRVETEMEKRNEKEDIIKWSIMYQNREMTGIGGRKTPRF